MRAILRTLCGGVLIAMTPLCVAQWAGSNDPSFNSSDVGWGQGFGVSPNTHIHALQVLASDQVLVAGDFAEMNRARRPSIARLFPDGSTDTTFNAGAGANTLIHQIVVQPDQRILVCGSFTSFDNVPHTRIARLLPDGALDPSFTITGTGLNGTVMAMCLQPDGKIIVAGLFNSYNGTNRGGIARLNADGSLDPSFANGAGFPGGSVRTIALQADGSVVVGGQQLAQYDGVYVQDLCRLLSDGALDTSFTPGNIFGGFSYVGTLAVQPDEKIIVGGFFSSIQGTPCQGLARVLPDGTLDASFNTSSGGQTVVLGIALQTDGQITFVGSFAGYGGNTTRFMARVDDTGLLDPSFQGGVGMDTTVFAIGLRSDGTYMMGGMQRLCQGHPSPGVTHLLNDGSVDIDHMKGSGFDGTASHLCVSADNDIYVTGQFTGFNNVLSRRLVKLRPDGERDTTFHVGLGFQGSTTAVLEQPDGKVLVAGAQQSYQGVPSKLITRLQDDGSLDTGFFAGPFGGANAYVINIALRPDGRILASFSDFPNAYDVVQLMPDGSIDPSFDTPGTFDAFPLDIEVQPDGKVLVAGFFTALDGILASGVLRLNTDGALDGSFVSGLSIGSQPIEMVLAPDGRITVIDGTISGRIARLMTDGSVDGTFDPGTGFDDTPSCLALDANGAFIVGGPFTSYDGVAFSNVARLLADGAPDPAFDPGSGIDHFGYTTTTWLYDLVLQSTGKIIIAGSMISYDGVGRNGIARVHNDLTTFVPVTAGSSMALPTPNPAHDHIALPATMGRNSAVEVFNAVGVRVLLRSDGASSPVLDIHAFPPGNYFARSAGQVVRFVKE